ncbi:MAG: methyltransferase domain-containing protein [Anaerolineales bacterium]|nr:methyltransferase domain-containing protein [Anaerolineales bacterium]
MNTTQIYLPDKHALAFYREKATPEFWDRHWQTDRLQEILRGTKDDGLFVPLIKRYLPANSTVLEGGCGMGQIVHALQYQGYKAIGIDFASQTIERIKEAVPELDVRVGDVRALALPDGSLDGYVSGGVIEHFWDGYEPIISEMERTLRVGGFLFISFPYLSPLRRLKIFFKMYPFARTHEMDSRADTFYQFALSSRRVQADLEALGFQMREFLALDGIKGFKDEITLFKPFLQEVYDGKRALRWRTCLDRFFRPYASHCALLVMQKVR